MSLLKRYSLYFAWVVSIIATVGSLFFSEVMDFIPCTLCWYQRILMYPMVILLGIATFKNDKGITTYLLPISILGFCTSTYHYLVQKVPFFEKTSSCTVGVPCSGEYINWLEFITIPFLALVAFAFITIFLFIARTIKD